MKVYKVLIDRKTRTIYLNGDVTSGMASMFRKAFKSLARCKAGEAAAPITVEVNSQGGECEAGQAIADTIRAYVPGVTTIAAGYAMSMGSVILAAGHTRQALRSTVIMVHAGHSRLHGKEHELLAEFNESQRIQGLIWDRLDEYTGKTAGFWKGRAGAINLYLTAEQAKADGLIHEVL